MRKFIIKINLWKGMIYFCKYHKERMECVKSSIFTRIFFRKQTMGPDVYKRQFDFCSVHSTWAFKKEGYETIIVNNNPETVSTDFDLSLIHI